jgi:hypothetical protein
MRRLLLFIPLCFAAAFFAPAQEERGGEAGFFDGDLDSLFEESPPDFADSGADGDSMGRGENASDSEGSSGGGLSSRLRQRGFILDAAYFFYGGVSPGWDEAPWHWDKAGKVYSTAWGAGINSALGLDFQISEHLRVKNRFVFTAPSLIFTVKEAFIDYNFFDRVFFRGGKFTQSWGISPNYAYANLLARLPPGNSGGDPYTVKVDVPIGIGGLEILALTRPGSTASSALDDIGAGAKYNMALRRLDMDLGVFYHGEMPLRNFVSLKSTLMHTELYAEAALALQYRPWGAVQGSGSVGFVRHLFSGKLILNGEYCYQGEKDAWYFNPETNLEEAEIAPLMYGHNVALNVLYRPGRFQDLRFFIQCRYSIDEDSAQLVPGLSLAPFPHIYVSLGFPLALGSRDGVYYRRNADKNNRPFSIVLLASISEDCWFARPF